MTNYVIYKNLKIMQLVKFINRQTSFMIPPIKMYWSFVDGELSFKLNFQDELVKPGSNVIVIYLKCNPWGFLNKKSPIFRVFEIANSFSFKAAINGSTCNDEYIQTKV